MAKDQKKRNVYTILFFLAVLFVAIGFERDGQISGQFHRSFPYQGETWYVPCSLDGATELGRTLAQYYSCPRDISTYCESALEGSSLPQQLRISIACSSFSDRTTFSRTCQTAASDLCV